MIKVIRKYCGILVLFLEMHIWYVKQRSMAVSVYIQSMKKLLAKKQL